MTRWVIDIPESVAHIVDDVELALNLTEEVPLVESEGNYESAMKLLVMTLVELRTIKHDIPTTDSE